MADDPERDDPVLVRPYITTQPAGEPTEAETGEQPAQTWPATADLPEDGPREQPVVAPVPEPAAKTTALRRQRLRLLAVLGVLALLGGSALLLLAPSDEDDPPPAARPVPTMATLTATPGAAPVVSGGARSLAPSSSGPARSATPTGTTATTGAPAQNATPPAAGAPTPTLSPPPGAARTSQIVAAGGRCLARGALINLGNAPVQTTGCADVLYQRFTLATDGTLQVTDSCARVTDDGTVRLKDCDDQPAGQWRAGPNGSLVTVGTGRCLTDPGSLATTVTVTDCTGADTQRWTLP